MLTQIDVIHDALIQSWASTVSYKVGRRVNHGGVVWEAVIASYNIPPSVSTPQWVSLGSGLDAPITEETALALPILGITPKDSLLVRQVTGLSPPDIDLFIGDYSRDGGRYQGRRVGNRNVVLTIDLNPNPALLETVDGLRELLYRTFVDPLVDGDHVELVLHDDDGRKRNLYGYTETFETEIFSVETLTQISLICPDPYIRDLVETVISNSTGLWITVPFTYAGTAETGFVAEIHVSASTPKLTIRNNHNIMTITHPFLNGDVVYLNTNRGSRDIIYVRDGIAYPLISKLDYTSKWIELHSQANTMSVYGATISDVGVAGIKTLTYRASYWGV